MPKPALGVVWITEEEYRELKRDSECLQALHAGGVDNWDWYSDSINQYYPEYWSALDGPDPV